MTELPLPYVPIDPRIKESQRFLDFMDAADIDSPREALSYITELLLFAGRMKVDGNLGTVTARQLARQCEWAGEPEALMRALVTSGWLTPVEGGHVIEGWDRHGGRVLQDRLRHRNRKQQRVSGRSAGGTPEPPGAPPEEHETLPPELEGELEQEVEAEEILLLSSHVHGNGAEMDSGGTSPPDAVQEVSGVGGTAPETSDPDAAPRRRELLSFSWNSGWGEATTPLLDRFFAIKPAVTRSRLNEVHLRLKQRGGSYRFPYVLGILESEADMARAPPHPRNLDKPEPRKTSPPPKSAGESLRKFDQAAKEAAPREVQKAKVHEILEHVLARVSQ